MRSDSLHEAVVKQARDSSRQGALRKLVGASWSAKLLYASCTVQVALRKLLRASCSGKLVPASGSLQVALCKLRSLQVALRKLLCASCSVQVALRKLLCASCSRQGALRKLVGASWSAQVALKGKLHLATPARGPGRNRTRDPPAREQAREPRDNSREVAKNLELLHLDHADLRRGFSLERSTCNVPSGGLRRTTSEGRGHSE